MTMGSSATITLSPCANDTFWTEDLPDGKFRRRCWADGDRNAIITGDGMMLTDGILPSLDKIDPPQNEYYIGFDNYRSRRRVDDFKGRTPVEGVNHIGNLCICLHSRPVHHSVLGKANSNEGSNGWIHEDFVTTDSCAGKKASGDPCDCRRFNPVAARASKHSFVRGRNKIRKVKAGSLVPGDRVLAGWSAAAGKLRLTENTKDQPMVVTLTGRKVTQADDRDRNWQYRMWSFKTDIGECVPIAGGTTVGVVSDS